MEPLQPTPHGTSVPFRTISRQFSHPLNIAVVTTASTMQEEEAFVRENFLLRSKVGARPEHIESAFGRHRDSIRQVCRAPLPFYVNFPAIVFLSVLVVALAVVTVFVVFDWTGFPTRRNTLLIANCPVWTWGTWFAVSWVSFFVLWAIAFTIREHVITRHYYRLLKVSFALYGVWMPSVYFVWACVMFAITQLLVNYGLDPDVYTWILRILWMNFVLALFCLVWEVLRRQFIVCIEFKDLWSRLATLVWHEELLQQLLHAVHKYGDSFDSAFERHVSYSTRDIHDVSPVIEPTVEDFDLWRGELFRVPEFRIDAPSILTEPTQAEIRQVQIARLAIRTANYLVGKLAGGDVRSISQDTLIELLGEDRAVAHLSFWDSDARGYIDKYQLAAGILRILSDRQELKNIFAGRHSLGIVLGWILGTILTATAILITLQIYTVNVNNIIVSLVAFLVPLVFIFGNSFRIVWESFLVVFFIHPWLPGDYVQMSGYPGFVVEKVELLTSFGHDYDGNSVRVPNAVALTSHVVRNGRSSGPARIRFLFRLRLLKRARELVTKVARDLNEYCLNRSRTFQKDTFVMWIDSVGGTQNQFISDEYLSVVVGLQVCYLKLSWEDYNVRMAEQTGLCSYLVDRLEHYKLGKFHVTDDLSDPLQRSASRMSTTASTMGSFPAMPEQRPIH